MRRVNSFITALMIACGLAACLCACGANAPQQTPSPAQDTPRQIAQSPALPGVPETLTLPPAPEGWSDQYLAFLENNYDIFQALWPDGISGLGFIDLDLDGTPEMVVFDQGASAALGAHIFDIIDGQVLLACSGLQQAADTFGGGRCSLTDVNANFFEAFRLSRTAEGWYFWVDSSNSTMEKTWGEVIRFESGGNALVPAPVCSWSAENDPATGELISERYMAGGTEVDAAAYQQAADVYFGAEDMDYNAGGVFLWSDWDRYGVPYEGFMAMARDAVTAYVPLPEAVTRVSVQG